MPVYLLKSRVIWQPAESSAGARMRAKLAQVRPAGRRYRRKSDCSLGHVGRAVNTICCRWARMRTHNRLLSEMRRTQTLALKETLSFPINRDSSCWFCQNITRTQASSVAQSSLTFRSAVLITLSIFPLHTCLPRPRVKPLDIWKGTCDGSDRANGVDYRVNNDRAALVGKGRSGSLLNVAGLFDADPLRAHRLGDLSEVGVLRVDAKGNDAGVRRTPSPSIVKPPSPTGRSSARQGMPIAHQTGWVRHLLFSVPGVASHREGPRILALVEGSVPSKMAVYSLANGECQFSISG